MPKQLFVLLFAFATSSTAFTQSSILAFRPIANEVSLYQNFFDDGDDAGQTLQVIAINSVKVFTDFQIELSADFNRKLTPGYNSDYYMEIGVLKPIYSRISLNVQRIYGTFVSKEINQVGIRLSF